MPNNELYAQIIPCELTYKIRKEVLWPHIKNGIYSLDIDSQKNTFHLGTFLNEKIVSIGTFVKQENHHFNCKEQYRLRAMATDSKYRKRNAAKTLFLKAIEILKNKNTNLLWCDARIGAIKFYQSVNMKSLEGTYNIPHIGEHKTMYIYLNSY